MNILEKKEKPKRISSSFINFSELRKLIVDNSTLDIVSEIKSSIIFEKDTKEIKFQLKSQEEKEKTELRPKSPIGRDLYPEFTHSYKKIEDGRELMIEIK